MKPASLKRLVLVAGLATGTMAMSQTVQNVDPSRHGNLAAAQSMIAQAYQRMTEAQQSNNYELGGHASRAKQLLSEAANEIGLAAATADGRRY
jgi:cellobiose-specific phosphotransferase system component IIA